MRRSDFQYELPEALIARHPLPERSGGRLLHLDGHTGRCTDRAVRDLPALLRHDDLLVFNDTRVVPARLFGRKESGGRIELLLERFVGASRALVQLRSSKPARPGTTIALARRRGRDRRRARRGLLAGRVRGGRARRLRAPWGDAAATVPVAPRRAGRQRALPDRVRTRARRRGGADRRAALRCRVAGGAAGRQVRSCAYVTLHVGAGTFQSVRVDDLAEHRMHAESVDVPAATCDAVAAARARGGARRRRRHDGRARARKRGTRRRVATLRRRDAALHHTWVQRFHVVDALVTNFHLPESTLLMLVCAFAGRENVLARVPRTRSPRATASSATATRCSSNRLPARSTAG